MMQKFALFIVVIAAGGSSSQAPAPEPAAIGAYRAAIASAEAGRTAGAVEAAFAALAAVREALMRPGSSATQGTILEALSDEAFNRAAALPGAIVNREEVLLVEPDPDYYVKLAAAHGDGGDRAFFAALKATYPESVWPVYVDQQTDISGCTHFGSGALVDAYRRWSAFQRAFPSRYVAAARKELDEVGARFTESTCACGDAASVRNEMQRFVAAFGTSPIGARVNQRLQDVRAGRTTIRTNCTASP
jgi:hypothetical protein